VTAGRAICAKKPPISCVMGTKPCTGSKCQVTEKPSTSMYPVQNTGKEKASTAKSITTRSVHVPAREAARMPSGMAKQVASTMVASANEKVGAMRCAMRSVTFTLENTERPRLPCSK
jgi:hypothetical protein